jgi:hypothetical protein
MTIEDMLKALLLGTVGKSITRKKGPTMLLKFWWWGSIFNVNNHKPTVSRETAENATFMPWYGGKGDSRQLLKVNKVTYFAWRREMSRSTRNPRMLEETTFQIKFGWELYGWTGMA